MRGLSFLVILFLCVGCSAPTPDHILIDKSEKTLQLFVAGQHYIFAIGTGKNIGDKQRVGDRRTPVGLFHIKAIIPSTDWAYDFEDGRGPIVGAYGPWFLELDTPWQGIAIHGTHDESTIGKNDSHGCVRMKNADVLFLKDKVKISFPVEIIE